MKYYLITGRTPETETEAAHDTRIEIGETNPFDSSGKPFKITVHEALGIHSISAWKQLIIMYATRITHEFIVTQSGVKRWMSGAESSLENESFVPAYHLIGLLNDGFVKSVEGKKLVYWKQRGRIEDEGGTTYTADEMLKLMDLK